VSEGVEFNTLLDMLKVISETSFSRQSLALVLLNEENTQKAKKLPETK